MFVLGKSFISDSYHTIKFLKHLNCRKESHYATVRASTQSSLLVVDDGVTVGAVEGVTDGVAAGAIDGFDAVVLHEAKCELCGVLNAMQKRQATPPPKQPKPPLVGHVGAFSAKIPTPLSPEETWSEHDAAIAVCIPVETQSSTNPAIWGARMLMLMILLLEARIDYGTWKSMRARHRT